MSEDLLAFFRETGALLEGHFILRSGLRSRQYFQCALLLQHPLIAAKVCSRLADKLHDFGCPFLSLLQIALENFEPDNLPLDLQAISAVKPGSK